MTDEARDMTDAEKLAEIAKLAPPGFGGADMDLHTLNAVRRILGVPEAPTSNTIRIIGSGGGGVGGTTRL